MGNIQRLLSNIITRGHIQFCINDLKAKCFFNSYNQTRYMVLIKDIYETNPPLTDETLNNNNSFYAI